MKEIKMLEFLQEILSGKMVILEVVSTTIIDYDSDYGFAGENYIVKLVEVRPSYNVSMDFQKTKVERTCIVNAIEFNSWVRKNEIVKFID